MWLVSVTRSQVWMGSRCVKFGVIALTLSYWSLEVQHGTSWQTTLWGSEKNNIIHKDGVGYKKIAKTLKLACWWPKPYSGLTEQVPLRTGLAMIEPKTLRARAQCHIQRLCLGNRWVLRALLQRLKGWGGSACQCSDHTLHTELN